jgi:aminoglycoside phosphotransferase (APT) family kinase protein
VTAAEAALAALLGDALAPAAGRSSAIAGIERCAPPARGSYRVEILSLRFADGMRERLFLKDFGSCTHAKPEPAARRWRELCVYRELLAQAEVGTPAYRGCVWDEARGRHWLLLAYVDGRRLRHLAFAHWLDAARWLGRMQARFARRDLSADDFLLAHDAAFYTALAERARAALAARSPRLATRLAAALRDHGTLADELAGGPLTLVHGCYRPYNLLVRGDDGICPTDWEESARGSPSFDLACLCDGFDGERLGALLDAYDEARAACGLPVEQRAQALRRLRLCWIHRDLRTLSKAGGPGFTRRGAEQLVERTRALARELSVL